LAADFKLSTNVMPFILRGVNLLGVNSTTLPNSFKQMIWEQIAEKMLPTNIEKIITKEVSLESSIPEFQNLLDATITGRTIIKIS
jgi:NADPH2:quinone reductase